MVGGSELARETNSQAREMRTKITIGSEIITLKEALFQCNQSYEMRYITLSFFESGRLCNGSVWFPALCFLLACCAYFANRKLVRQHSDPRFCGIDLKTGFFK